MKQLIRILTATHGPLLLALLLFSAVCEAQPQPRVWCVGSRETSPNHTEFTVVKCTDMPQLRPQWAKVDGPLSFAAANTLRDTLRVVGPSDWCVYRRPPGNLATEFTEAGCNVPMGDWEQLSPKNLSFAVASAMRSSLQGAVTTGDYCVYRRPPGNSATEFTVAKCNAPMGGWEILMPENLTFAAASAMRNSLQAGGLAPTMSAGTAMTGTTLTFFGSPSAAACQADCAKNPKCQGYTFIQAGTYSPGDPAMCYLLSNVTGKSTAKGHTSGMKSGGPIPDSPTGPTRPPDTGNPRPPTGPPTSSLNWSGTFTDGSTVVNASGTAASLSASFSYKASDYSGSGSWSGCKVDGNTATCNWTASHDDITKSGTRKGTLVVTLSGNTLSGSTLEDTPQWNYKPGYNASNVFSSMVKGAVFPFNLNRH